MTGATDPQPEQGTFDGSSAPEDVPSSGSFSDPATDSGTAAGDPLAGVGEPEEPPVYPEGSDEA